MKNRFLSWFLFGSLMGIVAQDAKSGGGGGTVSDAKAEDDEVPVAGADSKEPGLADRVMASVRSKGTLLSENREFRQRAEKAEADLAKTQGDLAAANAELTKLRAEQQRISDALATAESEKTTIAAAAADIVAQTGIPAEALPAQAAEGTDFESRHKAAMKAGPRALGAFMRENRAEIRQRLRTV